MIKLLSIFKKRKDATPVFPPIIVNPGQFIILANHLLTSTNFKFNLIGLTMATGAAVTELQGRLLVKQKDSNTIIYKSEDTSYEVTRHTLCDAGVVVAYMRSLVYNKTDSHVITWKLNRTIKHLFNTNITTKTLIKIYSILIEQSGHPIKDACPLRGCDIKLVEHDTLDLAGKIRYINSFKPIQITKLI
ncbi:hypothetical protein [Borrelia sp. P9F1]|uniref:hypothetical protein n=1 Tax=Borrelia sp. P9F1 TaxID=3058374 RepID=UPI0026480949|nr:hypothetical protein [Borrelia sp. P9F1]WKC58515.1 hypothetical protein QYZ68_04670 [Borrelia sp. P9F1]